LLYLPEENTFYILSPFKTSYFITSYLPFKLLVCQFMNTAYRCIIFIPCHVIFYKISIQPYSKLSDNRNIYTCLNNATYNVTVGLCKSVSLICYCTDHHGVLNFQSPGFGYPRTGDISGNRRTWRKPQTCRKSLTNYHIMLNTSPWTGFKLTTLVVIGTDYTGSCKSNYHTIKMSDKYVYHSDLFLICLWLYCNLLHNLTTIKNLHKYTIGENYFTIMWPFA
jgi:hypothetical protein